VDRRAPGRPARPIHLPTLTAEVAATHRSDKPQRPSNEYGRGVLQVFRPTLSGTTAGPLPAHGQGRSAASPSIPKPPRPNASCANSTRPALTWTS
jgi:hypothetical protein